MELKCDLVQGAHGEHGPVVGFDGLDECGVSPDVDVSIGRSGEHQVLRSTVTRRHHRLLLPQVPKDPPFKGEAAPCRTGGVTQDTEQHSLSSGAQQPQWRHMTNWSPPPTEQHEYIEDIKVMKQRML